MLWRPLPAPELAGTGRAGSRGCRAHPTAADLSGMRFEMVPGDRFGSGTPVSGSGAISHRGEHRRVNPRRARFGASRGARFGASRAAALPPNLPARSCLGLAVRFGWKADRRRTWRSSRHARIGRAACYAVKVKLLPVAHSTSFSGISCLARSMKFCPLQCIGNTCSISNFFSSAITCRR